MHLTNDQHPALKPFLPFLSPYLKPFLYFSLSSVASSGSVSSDSKMSITSDECRGPRQPQAKPPPKIIPSGKPPRHHADPSGGPTGVPVVHPRKSLNTRPDSMNSDSGIIGSSGSDTSQVRM